VLFAAESADEDDRLVASGIVQENAVTLLPRTEIADLVSIVPLSGELASLGLVAAMSGEGDVAYFRGGEIVRERVVGAGYSAEDSQKLGRMTALRQVGDRFFALGLGGQVYQRTARSGWTSLDGPRSGRDATSFAFFSVTELDGVYYFVGTERRGLVRTPELESANARGDAAQLAALILRGKRPDTVALWRYDGRWMQIEIDYPGTASEVLPYRGSRLVFTTNGMIIGTRDFSVFENLFTFEKRRSFQDIKAFGNEVCVLSGNILLLWQDSMIPFQPSLPLSDPGYINMSGGPDGFFSFEPDRIQRLEGLAWREIAYALG
jgi:hypothetical protein